MFPPGIVGELVVVALKAENLPNIEVAGKQDPLCVFRLGDVAMKTKTDVRGGQNPIWDDQVNLPVPVGATKLHMQLFDKNTNISNLIAEGYVDLSKVLREGEHDDFFPLTFRGKRAGEIYLELTFYSAQPASAIQQPVRYAARPPPTGMHPPPPMRPAYPRPPVTLAPSTPMMVTSGPMHPPPRPHLVQSMSTPVRTNGNGAYHAHPRPAPSPYPMPHAMPSPAGSGVARPVPPSHYQPSPHPPMAPVYSRPMQQQHHPLPTRPSSKPLPPAPLLSAPYQPTAPPAHHGHPPMQGRPVHYPPPPSSVPFPEPHRSASFASRPPPPQPHGAVHPAGGAGGQHVYAGARPTYSHPHSGPPPPHSGGSHYPPQPTPQRYPPGATGYPPRPGYPTF